jgi:homoserine dehydrogenase
MTRGEAIGIGLLGLGVVGGGVAAALLQKPDMLSQHAGSPLILRKVLVRSLSKERTVAIDSSLLSTEIEQVLGDPEIAIVVEVMGGEEPALAYIREALSHSKHVVTANKEVMSKYGDELVALAEEHGVEIFYEASVGGGIPLIAPLKQDLVANKVSALYGIINGTTNYILTKMSQEGMEFSMALELAQKLGYAEPDPANDVEGIDAAYKLAVLATLAFQTVVRPEDIFYEGITRLSDRDFRYARELGYAIKLLIIGKEADDCIEVRVHPVLIPEDLLLAKVDGVHNAVQIEGDLVGEVVFHGEGAGAQPTASAVIADIVTAAQSVGSEGKGHRRSISFQHKTVKPMSEIETRYYLRMSIADTSGVLAQIAKVLGDHSISISSVIQKEADAATQSAEIVLMTHPAQEWAVQQALTEIGGLPVVREIGNFIRVGI